MDAENLDKPKIEQRRRNGLGWIPDFPRKHKKYNLVCPYDKNIPATVDLRPKCPPVYDQGQLGSCTANGIAGGIEFVEKGFMPSRLFIYYNERVIEGDVSYDYGAQIYDGIKSISTTGVCSESEWPYDISKFAVQPPESCYSSARNDVINRAIHLDNFADIQQCIAKGFPVIFGCTLYNSFESEEVALSGVVPMPSPSDYVIGGHCMMIVGYDQTTGVVIVRNSWGKSWGQDGYCTMPYEYILEYANDFYSIQ